MRSQRSCDLVFRVGGDEFVAIVPAVGSTQEATSLAERIVKSARRPLPLSGDRLVPAVSVGVALMPPQGATPEAMLGAADRALYDAKRSGRDRAMVHG